MTATEIIGAMILGGMCTFSTYRFLYLEEQCSLMGWMALAASISTGIGVAEIIL